MYENVPLVLTAKHGGTTFVEGKGSSMTHLGSE